MQGRLRNLSCWHPPPQFGVHEDILEIFGAISGTRASYKSCTLNITNKITNNFELSLGLFWGAGEGIIAE